MKAVGIKRLKARLSEYVRMAKAGETVLVMGRDEVVAELRPAQHRLAPPSEMEETLERLAETGEVTRASIRKAPGDWRPPRRGLPPGVALRVLEELRLDRID